jgi:DNA-binding NtrC family response regulator
MAKPKKTKRVLMVEDDPGVQRTLKALIEREGFIVDMVDNPVEAIKYLASSERDPCLVIADMLVSGMSKELLIRCITPPDVLLSIPVVLMSARAKDYGEEAMHKVTFIKKPFGIQSLIKHIKKWCSEH